MSQVAILVPVLNRPHRVAPLIESIEESTDAPHRTIFAASDQPTIDELDRLGADYITDDGGNDGTYPKRINRLFNATTESYVFTGADDLAFRANWFENAMRVMETLIHNSGVVAINDLHNMAGTHFLISRGYINEFGGSADCVGQVLCEAYLHTYCDDELRAVAKSRDRFAFAQQSIVEHLHVGAGKSPMDETYRIGEATMSQGFEVFQSRGHLWNG